MQLPFGTSAAGDRRIEQLAALWERARSATAHPTTCMCRGMVAAALDPRIIEDDILEYLHTLYQDNDRANLSAVVAGRRAQLMAPAGAERFEQWVARLADLPPADRDILLTDLDRVLQSFGALDQGGFGCY
jgi:hypothetical protein